MKGAVMKRTLLSISLIGSLLFLPGCMGRLIGEGAETALGPKGDYWEQKSVASRKDHKSLLKYQQFELGSVKNEIGRLLPPEFIGMFRKEFSDQLDKSNLPNTGRGKTLLVDVSIVHYEKADMTDNVFGPLEQVVARVKLVDKDSGKVLAVGNAIGRTGKTVGMGVDNKAEGLAKGLVKWISDYYPKPEKEEKKAKKTKGKKHRVEDDEEDED
jgi:hypothetical protein